MVQCDKNLTYYLDKCVSLTGSAPYFSPRVYQRTYEIHVDASTRYLGYYANESTQRSELITEEMRSINEHISYFETLAIHHAIKGCPDNSNLIIHSDN